MRAGADRAAGEVTQLHVARPGRRGASGNFGGGAGLPVGAGGSRRTPRPRERPPARAGQTRGPRGRPCPRHVSRFSSISPTKANWQVRLINFGGMRPSRGALEEGRREPGRGSCPRELPVSSRGARARPGWHLPEAAGGGRRPRGCGALGIPRQTRTGVGTAPRRSLGERSWGGRGQEGGGSPRAGPAPGSASSPKSKARVCVLLVMLGVPGWHLHRWD